MIWVSFMVPGKKKECPQWGMIVEISGRVLIHHTSHSFQIHLKHPSAFQEDRRWRLRSDKRRVQWDAPWITRGGYQAFGIAKLLTYMFRGWFGLSAPLKLMKLLAHTYCFRFISSCNNFAWGPRPNLCVVAHVLSTVTNQPPSGLAQQAAINDHKKSSRANRWIKGYGESLLPT